MVVCGNKHYDSFEELGDVMLRDLPKESQPVKWWRGWHVYISHHKDWTSKTPWQKIGIRFPRFNKSRSWVGYFWLHTFLFNRWDMMFTCGCYKFDEESKL